MKAVYNLDRIDQEFLYQAHDYSYLDQKKKKKLIFCPTYHRYITVIFKICQLLMEISLMGRKFKGLLDYLKKKIKKCTLKI